MIKFLWGMELSGSLMGPWVLGMVCCPMDDKESLTMLTGGAIVILGLSFLMFFVLLFGGGPY